MKKRNVLIVLLIGLLLVVGLVVAGCQQVTCRCSDGHWTHHKNCDNIFCASNINPKKDCNCLDHYESEIR
jgi:hypothetical protein